MRKTTNYGLVLYDTTDKMNITGSQDSLNASMEIIDKKLKEISDKPSSSGGSVELSTSTLYGVPTYFQGKKILVTGDSITDVVGNYANGHPWWQNLKDWLGLAGVYNDGKSSTGLLRNTGIYYRIDTWNTTYGTDFDAIIIMGNMNDIYKDVSLNTFSLGEFGDNTVNTQYGIVKLTIEKIQALYPMTPILWVTSSPRKNYGRLSVNPINPGHGRTGEFEDYVNAIIEVCGHYNVPVCDMYHNSFLRPWVKQNNDLYFQKSDGVHPNQLGHEIMAQEILQDFVRLIPSVDGTSGLYTKHDITYSLTDTKVINNLAHISTGSTYSAYVEPISEDYILSSVKVTMGGSDITSSAYNSSTKAITISSVTENVTVTATSMANGNTYNIEYNLTNVSSSNVASTILENKTYTANLTGKTGYDVGTVNITMGGEDITSTAYDSNTEKITITSVTGDIIITATGVAKTLRIVNNLTGVVNSNTDETKLYGESYTGTLTVIDENTTIQYIYITMGETDVTSDVYDSSTGVITIPSVTDNVVINASNKIPFNITADDFERASVDNNGVYKVGDAGLDNIATPEIIYMEDVTINLLTDDIMLKIVEYDVDGKYIGNSGWMAKVKTNFTEGGVSSYNIQNKYVRVAGANTSKKNETVETLFNKLKIVDNT